MGVEAWVEAFEWESETQKKGFLALLKFLRDRRVLVSTDAPWEDRFGDTLNALAAWFIEKDHQSNEWWDKRLSDLAQRHDREIERLTNEIADIKALLHEAKLGSEKNT